LRFETLRPLLPKLKELKLSGCKFLDLPPEICGDRDENVVEAVRAHYRDLEEGRDTDTEVKVFLLGNGGAGKTQLCRRLRGLAPDFNLPSTHGIQLSETSVGLEDIEQPIQLNMWDFGGQEIYHGSHALFLQGHAVFVIVWTPELENAAEYEESGIVMHHRPLRYWLDYVRSFAGTGSPVLVVQSKCDSPAQRIYDVPIGGISKDLSYFQVAQASALTGLGLDLLKAGLKEAVRDCISRRPPMPIGQGRARVRVRLRQLRNEDQQLHTAGPRHRFLQRAEFDRLCEEEGGISDTEAFLQFLHTSGVVYYRAGIFGGRIVIDQNWALEGIYAVFDRKRGLPRLHGYGRFSRADLELLCWSGYTRQEQSVFLEMMESSGICFKCRLLADGQWEYVAPELLPDRSAAEESLLAGRLLTNPAEVEANARYKFLHEGVLRNYLSRIGQRAGDAAIYWKYGCWFYERTTDSRVMIETAWEDDKTQIGPGAIRFRAWGKRGGNLIAPLVEELNRLPANERPEIVWRDGERAGELPSGIRISDVPLKRDLPIRRFDRPASPDLSALSITRALQPPSGQPVAYVSYAWGDDSDDGRRYEQFVERLCREVQAAGWRVVHDKTQMRHGDLISVFMKLLSRADRIIVVLTGKYLRSSYCMTELYGIYKFSFGEKEDFLRRVIPFRLEDARIGNWRDRVAVAKFWESEFHEMEASLTHMGPGDFELYKAMQDWHNHVGEILEDLADMLHPVGSAGIEKDGFAGLKAMLGAPD
jgi:internalin A